MKNFHDKEMERLLKSPRGTGVWLRMHFEKWVLVESNKVSWFADCEYIVDDIQAKFRKLQIDRPDTKFQAYSDSIGWVDHNSTSWDINVQYKLKEDIFEYQWIFKRYSDEWSVSKEFYVDNPKLGFDKCMPFEHTKRKVKNS